MKTKLGLLFVSLSFGLPLVFVPSGYGHKPLIASKAPAATLVSFEDYSKMESVRDRTAALAKESPYAKSVLWRKQLAYYKARLELNAQQKHFLERVSEFLDESIFTISSNVTEAAYIKTERGKPFKELMQNVKTLFTPEQRRQLFLTIGDIATITDWGCGTPKEYESEASVDKAHGPNASEPANNSAAFSNCHCTESLCGSQCGSNQYCASDCTPQGSCGCFRLFSCDGICKTILP